MNRYQGTSFFKFSATGNDFILIDNREIGLSEQDALFFQRVCERRTSVGADGVLLIDRSQKADFRLRYFNRDGTEAECGNGARTAAWFASTRKIALPNMKFEFDGAEYEAQVSGNHVRLKLPQARDLVTEVGILEETDFEEGGAVNTGVPHYVVFDFRLEDTDVQTLGQKYRYHPRFAPTGTNVNFVLPEGPETIRVRTYERGVEAETLSCGTGAVATALIANLKKGVQFPTTVYTRGGMLKVHKESADMQFYLEGEVRLIYEGKLH